MFLRKKLKKLGKLEKLGEVIALLEVKDISFSKRTCMKQVPRLRGTFSTRLATAAGRKNTISG